MIAAVIPGNISAQEALPKKSFIGHGVLEGAHENESGNAHGSCCLGDCNNPGTLPAPARRAVPTRCLRRTAAVRGPGCSHRRAHYSANCLHHADLSRPANTRTRPSHTPDSE